MRLDSRSRWWPCSFALVLAGACASDDADTNGAGEVDDAADDDAADDQADDDAADDDGVEPGESVYEESFDGADGSAWPDPWQVVGTRIIDAEIDDGRGRMSGQTNLTARLVLPGYDLVDADITVVVEYENFAAQGYGFYARQNGGALEETDPPGQGYGVYVEGGSQRSIGVWKEIGGVESPVLEIPNALADGIEAGTPYAIRFQCMQRDDSTLLRAKVWRKDGDEPDAWMVETEDSTSELQGTSGSFANDIYNYSGTGSVWVHSVTIREL